MKDRKRKVWKRKRCEKTTIEGTIKEDKRCLGDESGKEKTDNMREGVMGRRKEEKRDEGRREKEKKGDMR